MGIIALALLALWVVKTLLPAGLERSLPAVVRLFLDLSIPLLAIPAVYYIWKLFSLIRSRLLWKIRTRLILAHILIAAIPIFLVVAILYVSGLLFYYQLSYYLIQNQIGIHTAQVHAFNLSLSAGLQQAVSAAGGESFAYKPELDRDAKYLLGEYPTASIILRVQDPATGRPLVFGSGDVDPEPDDYRIPQWAAGGEFSGLVYEDVQPGLYRRTGSTNSAGRGRLYLRSFVTGEFRPEVPYSLEISVPFDGYMLDRLKAALGQDLVIADHIPNSGLNVMLRDTDLLRENILSSTFDLGAEGASVGRPVWSILLYPVSWAEGVETGPANTEVLFVELSTSRLMQNVFHSESSGSRTILGVLEIVVGFFLLVELISLLGGIMLTKSITNAVHNLDRGTQFIRRGDFSHRIVVKSDDQLGALARSFNRMTDYIQSLVRERVEKERLERELEIAKEVQEQLFPRSAPQMTHLDLSGVCLPARVVSGDYYDFLRIEPGRIGIALGDICGKGISAALLMANLQATLRSNVTRLSQAARLAQGDGRGAGAPRAEDVAEVVKVLNHQIYSNTSANKFASFFYSVYDDSSATLSFCNAGHNPPLFFRNGGFERLSEGGTVVGIFPDAEFEERILALHPGDLFVAYTDGITESVNEYGEEFGEERLIELISENLDMPAGRLQERIMKRVLEWAYEEERDDDMTLIVAKVR